MNKIPSLLFLCVENSNRSQMAEAFARLIAGNKVRAFSAGSNPSGKVNPKAIAAMQELGYDMSAHSSKAVSDLPDTTFDFVATMGCGDSCAVVKSEHSADWQIPDPKELPPEAFREVRDTIGQHVRAQLEKLGVELGDTS